MLKNLQCFIIKRNLFGFLLQKKICSFEDFKTACYKELSDDSYLSEEDKLFPPLLDYYKKFNIGYLKKYNNNFRVNLTIKDRKINRSKIVDGKISRYEEIEYELISLAKDGSEYIIFDYRQQWVFEKKPLN